MTIKTERMASFLNNLALAKRDDALLVKIGDDADLEKYSPILDELLATLIQRKAEGFHICNDCIELAVRLQELIP